MEDKLKLNFKWMEDNLKSICKWKTTIKYFVNEIQIVIIL